MAAVVLCMGSRGSGLGKLPLGDVAAVLEGMMEGGSLDGDMTSSTICRLGDADR